MDIKARIKKAAESFVNLDESDLTEFVIASRSLSIEECYSLILVEVSELSEEETKFCALLHSHGRALGVKDATEKLFYQMQTKGGGTTAIEYLKQMGAEFSTTPTPSSGKQFAFQVVIPEE